MPSVADNKGMWNDRYDWPQDGREWSVAWGSAEDQWIATIQRRIFPLLPTGTILEIAPGYGRWTAFLLKNCEKLIGIDISSRAIDVCKERFSDESLNATFVHGDGLTFSGVADGSIDFVFSFDSLVHAELDCITSYAKEIDRVLVPGGYAFLHHSNLAEYMKDGKLMVAQDGWRGLTVSAETAGAAFSAAGLQIITQEKNQWTFGRAFCDCFSLIRRPLAAGAALAPGKIFHNQLFGQELVISTLLHQNYTSLISQVR